MQRSLYITEHGFRSLQVELQECWKKRADVTRALSAAAAEGDRSENAEYIYRKKELRELDKRIRYLQKRIPELKAVAIAPADRSKIYFGAIVTIEDESTGISRTVQIVGSDEIDTATGRISIDSPVARALLGHRRDDRVTISAPNGQIHYCVLEITYP